MKITIEWLNALVIRGWSVRGRPALRNIEFRTPDGISGDEYQCESLEGEFPQVVSDWIMDNVPRTTIGIDIKETPPSAS